jgi:hypothetical protein
METIFCFGLFDEITEYCHTFTRTTLDIVIEDDVLSDILYLKICDEISRSVELVAENVEDTGEIDADEISKYLRDEWVHVFHTTTKHLRSVPAWADEFVEASSKSLASQIEKMVMSFIRRIGPRWNRFVL